MTTEAVALIHELTTVQNALRYLRSNGPKVPDQAFEHFIDFHLGRKTTLLRLYEARDWHGLAESLQETEGHWTSALPIEITEHQLTRIEQEERALKICVLRILIEAARGRHEQQAIP